MSIKIPSPPPASSAAVRATMQGNRRTATKPEVALRSALHAAGLRFRKDHRLNLDTKTVKPDVVFTKARVAVFLDGCFWHSCPEHGRSKRGMNDEYWTAKLARNVERDRENDAALNLAGWTVLRVWEHVPTVEATAVVAKAVAQSHSEHSSDPWGVFGARRVETSPESHLSAGAAPLSR